MDHYFICVSPGDCYSYLQSTTQLNCICIIYYSYSEVWSLQEFFEEKAIFQDFAAYWESERRAKKMNNLFVWYSAFSVQAKMCKRPGSKSQFHEFSILYIVHILIIVFKKNS